MATERDLAVAQMCIERGYATPEQVEACLKEASSAEHTARPLEAVLRRYGYISEEIYRELSKHERRAPGPPPRLDPEVEQASLDPSRRFGKYILLKELGAGGMGVVYRAFETDLRRYVALKFIRGVEAERDLERFLREAQLAATLSHPGIAPIYESGVHEGKHYFAMQFVEGRTLDQVLAAPLRPSLRRCVEILVAVAEAVEYAHEHGIIHRDLKPANIMVDGRDRAYVMDFGLAKSVRTGSSLTGSGLTVGTPAYMSPEQAQGDPEGIGPRSDVYALGACLYQLGTGRAPFDGENVVQLLMDVVHHDPVPPRRLNPKFPVDLETIALKALDKDPARRYASAAEFGADLRRWMEGEPILARPVGAMSRAVRRIRKHKMATAGVLALVAGLSVGGGIWMARAREKSARTVALPFYEAAEKAYGEADRIRFMAAGSTENYSRLITRAEENARKAVDLDPSYADAHFLLARALRLRKPNTPEAFHHLTRTLELAPGHTRARLDRGLTLLWEFFERYGIDAVSSRLGTKELQFSFLKPDPERESFREGILWDLGKITGEREYEKELITGAIELASWRPGDTARLDRAEPHLLRAAELGPNETDPLKLLSRVRICRGDVKGGADRMAQALKLAPNDPLLLHAMSVTLLVGRRYEEAIPMIERALSLSPKNAGLLNLRGNCRLHLGQPDLALEDFVASAKLDVTSPYPLGNAGYVHYAAGRNEQALRFYDEALGRSPGDPDYLEARGLVLFQMGRLEEAEAELDRLVAARPDAGAYSNRGAVRSRRERFAEAEADYREALRLSPDDPGTTYNLAILRQRQGRIDEAAELYRKSIDLGRTQPETWRALVKALLRIRKAAEAEAACTQGLQAAPGDVALIWDRALARAEQGNLEGALADYRKVLELKPGEARLERDIGVTLTKLGRMEEAIGPLERAVAGGATDVLSLLATCFTHAGQMEKAGAAYDRGVEVHPRNPMNWFARAQFRHRVGKAAEAVLDLDQAISLNSEFAEAIGFRGVLKLELKQSAAAVKDLQRAIDLKPGLRETFGPFLEKVKEE